MVFFYYFYLHGNEDLTGVCVCVVGDTFKKVKSMISDLFRLLNFYMTTLPRSAFVGCSLPRHS